ncbi:MAG: Polyketide cyclase / dehydrase and lipid transport [Methanomassiliicoccales archaeon PtaB.Bin215]|nr:MAG: Polyketide cyclase / dehydrase and lipid transport [Methanomassiliicoccales archaeon PtaB.Bin215]
MKEIKGSVMINVPADKVWAVLSERALYQEWNPFITQLSGELKEGNLLDVTVVLPDRKDTKFKSKVVKVEPNKELLTKGAIKKGLLTSEHSFLIEVIEENKCVFSQKVIFTGLMTLFAGKVIKDSQVALNRMNEEMKKRCEKK